MNIIMLHDEFEQIISHIEHYSTDFDITELQPCLGMLYSIQSFAKHCFVDDENKKILLFERINEAINLIEKRKSIFFNK